MSSKYIHPNFNPKDKNEYLDLINKLREKCLSTDLKKIEVSKKEYAILENASHSSMKNKGHQVYGVEVVMKLNNKKTII